nr:uncharacterized protein LOC112284789 isoform X1 [Physcomitrium patens]|eukprot:XP_024380791.1 uncharacterized protein LOC112284789 isoform X1 [Physcomitrella patens]
MWRRTFGVIVKRDAIALPFLMKLKVSNLKRRRGIFATRTVLWSSFECNTYSAANIFDVSLHPQMSMTRSVEWLSLVVVFRQVKYQKVFVIKLVSSEQDKNFAIMDWRCFPLNSKGIIISINTAIFTHT